MIPAGAEALIRLISICRHEFCNFCIIESSVKIQQEFKNQDNTKYIQYYR